MAILLALLSALGYGTSDFCAGLLSRRYAAEPVAGTVIAVEVATAVAGVLLFGGDGPRVGPLAWGALSGLGGGAGTLMLYRGLAAGQMAVTATLSAVLAAVLPALVGLALGNHLSPGAAVGITIAVPAIALVSWQPGGRSGAGRSGAVYGLLAGLGFALLFVGLDRAGTRSGAWPLLPGQSVGLLVVAPGALRGWRRVGRPRPRDLALALFAGVIVGAAALSFLAATGHGELSIIAVVTALYPAFTVLLARVVLSERWSRAQATGLIVAAASIVLVSIS
jgi:uncharacterized membrane protein